MGWIWDSWEEKVEKGTRAMERGQHSAATKFFQQACARAPESQRPSVQFLLAVSYANNGQYNEGFEMMLLAAEGGNEEAIAFLEELEEDDAAADIGWAFLKGAAAGLGKVAALVALAALGIDTDWGGSD